MPATQLDTARADAFADRMVGMLNEASIALMASIGHRTGLFDAMADLPPSTSHTIAEKAGLHERYVREWLGAMTTGRVVEHDPEAGTYYLPPEHAACLTRAAAPNNIAMFAQYIPVLGQVEDPIIECFKNGGGVPYSKYPRFHEVMSEDSGQTVTFALLDAILPLVPDGIEKLRRGIDVLDIGCGSGRAANLLARTFPNSRVTGYDFSREAIENARGEAAKHNTANVYFEIKDVTHLNGDGKFDLITAFDAIHDQAHPDRVLAGIYHSLRDDGVFLMQDIAGSSHVHNNLDHPVGPLLYTVSCMHCMTVSLALDGAGLGAMWGREKAEAMLAEAGFKSVEVKQLEHDFQNYYYVVRK